MSTDRTLSMSFMPLSANTHDATHNRMQRDINEAADHILAALDGGVTCPDCRSTVVGPVRRHVLIRAAGRSSTLSLTIYSLALSELLDQGVLTMDGDSGVQRAF